MRNYINTELSECENNQQCFCKYTKHQQELNLLHSTERHLIFMTTSTGTFLCTVHVQDCNLQLDWSVQGDTVITDLLFSVQNVCNNQANQLMTEHKVLGQKTHFEARNVTYGLTPVARREAQGWCRPRAGAGSDTCLCLMSPAAHGPGRRSTCLAAPRHCCCPLVTQTKTKIQVTLTFHDWCCSVDVN